MASCAFKAGRAVKEVNSIQSEYVREMNIGGILCYSPVIVTTKKQCQHVPRRPAVAGRRAARLPAHRRQAGAAASAPAWKPGQKSKSGSVMHFRGGPAFVETSFLGCVLMTICVWHWQLGGEAALPPVMSACSRLFDRREDIRLARRGGSVACCPARRGGALSAGV